MIDSFQNSKGGSRIGRALIGGAMGLLLTACAFAQPFTQSKVKDEVLADGPRGAVFLQKVQDGWFKTAHPLSLSPAMVASVLQGIHLKSTPTGNVAAVPVFSDDDTEFLSALMSAALSKAGKSQVVGFRVNRATGAGSETTGGILYVQGRLLHLTFTHYRAQQDQSGHAGLALPLVPNPTGLDSRQVSFVPETVQRSSRHEQPDVITTPPVASLVIDYGELSTALGLQPTLAQPHPVRMDQPPGIQQQDQSIPLVSPGSPAHSLGTDPTPSSIEDRLRMLKRLHDQGLITEDDYGVKKQQLLEKF